METILFCPLNWGLGHATRIIPLIQQNLSAGHRVVIAGYGRSLDLLKKEFPQLEFADFEGFNVRYNWQNYLGFSLILQLPQFYWYKKKENKNLAGIIARFHPTKIISDNRYGVYHKDIESIIITHQLNPQLPAWLKFFEPVVQFIIKRWVSRFDACWIPDLQPPHSLSGALSALRAMPLNIKYIGILSRFKPQKQNSTRGKFVLAIISGPEPERTRFCDLCRTQLMQMNQPAILVTGEPEKELQWQRHGELLEISHLSALRLNYLVNRCLIVVCRSGYSSVMDLVITKTNALLVPTPGQSEQLYLAEYLMNRHHFFSVHQQHLQLDKNISTALGFKDKVST